MTEHRTSGLPRTDRVRILVLTANPTGTTPLRSDRELKAITEVIERAEYRDRFAEPAFAPAAGWSDLSRGLRAHDPHILHYSGHGEHDGDLAFEDDAGVQDPVRLEHVRDLLAAMHADVRMVVLNACWSAERADALASEVDFVISMSDPVPDQAAIAFAEELYRGLGAGDTVETAFDAAKVAISRFDADHTAARDVDAGTDSTPVTASLGDVPRLSVRPGADAASFVFASAYWLGDRGHTRLTRATWRQWLGERMSPRTVGACVVALLAVVFADNLAIRLPAVQSFACRHVPPACLESPMSGDLNIAVARFGVPAQSPAGLGAEAAALSESTAQTIRTELAGLRAALAASGTPLDVEIEIRGPDEIGLVSGATPRARAEAAAAVAQRLRADVVVYGELSGAATGTAFAPEFYLSDRRIQWAEELAGQYAFGQAVSGLGDIERNPVARTRFKQRVGARIRSLAYLMLGLGYFTLREYPRALDLFEQAETATDWGATGGSEVLYLFIGHTNARLGDLPAAERAYATALSVQPDYARARLGAAEVLFQKARADCTAAHADIDGLLEARAAFDRAAAARLQPVIGDIAVKTAFGRGRVGLCLTQAGADEQWADARTSFEQVVQAYREGNPRVGELAVEAQANLGLLAIFTARDADRDDHYRGAIAAYQQAIDLGRSMAPARPEREALFTVWQAWCQVRLGAPAEATVLLARADGLYAQVPDELRSASYDAFRAQVAAELADPTPGAASGGMEGRVEP
jgi:tetratricopeptide (TPR) repeat protein